MTRQHDTIHISVRIHILSAVLGAIIMYFLSISSAPPKRDLEVMTDYAAEKMDSIDDLRAQREIIEMSGRNSRLTAQREGQAS